MPWNSNSLLSAIAYLYMAFLILVLPVRWLLGWALAIVLHELGHLGAVWVCGGKVLSWSINPGGLDIVVTQMVKHKQFICILFGPILGVLPVLLRTCFPELAVFSFVLTAYNLIPVRPLDGGRLLELLVGCNDFIFLTIERIILGLVVVLCIILQIKFNVGVLPAAIALQLIIKNRKIACKREVVAVQ